MAQRTVIRLVDDLDDTEIVDGAGETVNFGIDGREYEIDLTNDHADEMRAALDRYVKAGRTVGGRQRRARATATVAKAAAPVEYSTQAVRVWARANKIELSPRGRIPRSVVDRFRAAGN
jgi:Lsr2